MLRGGLTLADGVTYLHGEVRLLFGRALRRIGCHRWQTTRCLNLQQNRSDRWWQAGHESSKRVHDGDEGKGAKTAKRCIALAMKSMG
jgi:hypothetical protein